MSNTNDFKVFLAFCSDNGLNPSELSSRKAFEESHTTSKKTRKHERKDVTVLCIARNESGEVLFKRATVPNLKSQKEHVAWVLTCEAVMGGYDSARCVTIGEEIELG